MFYGDIFTGSHFTAGGPNLRQPGGYHQDLDMSWWSNVPFESCSEGFPGQQKLSRNTGVETILQIYTNFISLSLLHATWLTLIKAVLGLPQILKLKLSPPQKHCTNIKLELHLHFSNKLRCRFSSPHDSTTFFGHSPRTSRRCKARSFDSGSLALWKWMIGRRSFRLRDDVFSGAFAVSFRECK